LEIILFQERDDMFIMSMLACQHVTQHNNISFSRGKSISRLALLAVAVGAVVAALTGAGDFTLLSTIVGIALLIILLTFYETPGAEAKRQPVVWQTVVFSAIVALCIVLILGVFLNLGYPPAVTPDMRTKALVDARTAAYYLPGIFGDPGNQPGFRLTWGDVAATAVWLIAFGSCYLFQSRRIRKNTQPGVSPASRQRAGDGTDNLHEVDKSKRAE